MEYQLQPSEQKTKTRKAPLAILTMLFTPITTSVLFTLAISIWYLSLFYHCVRSTLSWD